MSRLIVNADDFGLTAGVNRAIAELHRAGVLTSATLMSRAAATDHAIDMALSTPLLDVGCHVVLVDGEPALKPAELPSLVDPGTGRFQHRLSAFVQRLLAGRVREAEIEAEAAAQIALLQRRGVRLTHIDTHKHTHMFPAVLRPILRAAKAAGIRAVRNPFEPAWSLRATPGIHLTRRIELSLLQRFEAAFRQITAEEGFVSTDGAIGVLATGALDATTIASLLTALPEGTFEMVSHPGYNDAALAQTHSRLLASREAERNSLQKIKQFPGVELISFAALHIETAQRLDN
ncbi:MAG: ChbG/HpnK family deacetylase [Acidobacteriota bacterium]|nr:ChbG/HpnK family deacetylase [Acidobacteriota bacterium]